MSVCVAIFDKDGKTLHFAADTRIATKINGVYHRKDDNCKKIYEFDGYIAYISGITRLAKKVAEKIKFYNIRNPDEIALIMKEESEKYITPYKKENPHYLQALIPYYYIKEKSWILVYIDSAYNFEPEFLVGDENVNSYFAIGVAGRELLESLEWDGCSDIISALLKAFEQVSSERCGGNMIYYRLRPTSVEKKIMKINEHHETYGEGDGMYTRADGFQSAKGYMRKYNGGLKYAYYSSNVANERSIDFRDDGILVKSEYAPITLNSTDLNLNVSGRAKINHASGTVIEVDATGDNVKIMHKNGSYYELTPTGRKEYIVGNAETVCTGNFKVTASRIDLN